MADPQSTHTFTEWAWNQGPAIFLMSVFIVSLARKIIVFGYQLVEQKKTFDDQMTDVRKGHAERCADYEKRLEKKDQEALEWRNLALRLGMATNKATSIAEKAVTLVDKPAALTE